MFNFIRKAVISNRVEETILYEYVYDELEDGFKIRGLWAKALAMSEGNEDKATSLYMQYRVQNIRDIFTSMKIAYEELSKSQIKTKLKQKVDLNIKSDNDVVKEKNKKEEIETKQINQESILNDNLKKKALEKLEKFGYKVNFKSNYWLIKEPLGGKRKIDSIEDLIEYANSRESLSNKSNSSKKVSNNNVNLHEIKQRQNKESHTDKNIDNNVETKLFNKDNSKINNKSSSITNFIEPYHILPLLFAITPILAIFIGGMSLLVSALIGILLYLKIDTNKTKDEVKNSASKVNNSKDKINKNKSAIDNYTSHEIRSSFKNNSTITRKIKTYKNIEVNKYNGRIFCSNCGISNSPERKSCFKCGEIFNLEEDILNGISNENDALTHLNKLGYKTVKNSKYWLIKEPLGAKVKIYNENKLLEYANSKR